MIRQTYLVYEPDPFRPGRVRATWRRNRREAFKLARATGSKVYAGPLHLEGTETDMSCEIHWLYTEQGR